MEDGKLKRYFQMFTDVWKLFKEYSQPDGSNQFWNSYKTAVDQLDRKYERSELFRNLALAVTKELERIEKQRK